LSSLPLRINEQPHPDGDECVACGLEGWRPATNMTTADGKPVTVAEGYGNFEGYVLIADGHIKDEPVYTPVGSFRCSSISRRAVIASEMTFAD